MANPESYNVFWFRRDLRLADNHGLSRALQAGRPVIPIFIFDQEILSRLQDRDDARVSYIYQQTRRLDEELKKHGSRLLVLSGRPPEVFSGILSSGLKIECVFTNHDFEPYPIRRDREIKELLGSRGVAFQTFKDHVVFERSEVVKDDGKPYTVFTPYSRKWKARLGLDPIPSHDSGLRLGSSCQKMESLAIWNEPLSLERIGFNPTSIPFPEPDYGATLLRAYAKQRDFPAVQGTSKVGLALRFGTLSVRELAQLGRVQSETWLNELIWRDFFTSVLWHFPHTVKRPFRPQFEKVEWRDSEEDFSAWCAGQTGYPLVDAGMRELNATGFMHNRVRMVVASFLTKHLLLPWQWGERYFARKLLDYELASNVGNWQWAAGTGCDAAPYFRVFNPESQQAKFDPKGEYVRRWVPEVGRSNYPPPIIDHKVGRARALAAFSRAKS